MGVTSLRGCSAAPLWRVSGAMSSRVSSAAHIDLLHHAYDDAIIALGRHLQRRDYHERYVPGNGIDIPDEWEPLPFDEEPPYWDDVPEVQR